MISLHRLRGEALALNPDLFERIEANPDTTITLVDGSKYNVMEPIADVLVLIQEYRATVIRMSHQMEEGTYVHPRPEDDTPPSPGATVHRLPQRGN